MSNDNNTPDLDHLMGDDTQDPADHFLIRDGDEDQEEDMRQEVEDENEDNLTDVEADSMTLASAGMGTDEDYGFFGDCGGED